MDKLKTEFSSRKFMSLLLVVCLVFFIIVIKAFEYLPDSEPVSRENINKINTIAEINKTEVQDKKSVQPKTLNISLPSKMDDVELDEIEAPKEVEIIPPPTKLGEEQPKEELSKEDKIANGLENARKYKKNSQYINALEEYKNVLSLTDNKEIVAQCYEEIAAIYGIARRYGTALSYATKAYNTYPTSNREMLLARLYYKTGDIDRATTRINNILRRDFSDDR